MPAVVAIGFFLIIAAFVAAGMVSILKPMSNGFLGWLVSGLGKALFFGASLIPGANSLAKWLIHNVGQTFLNNAKPMALWLKGMKDYVNFTGLATFAVPYDLYRVISWLVLKVLPRHDKAVAQHAVSSAAAAAGKAVPRGAAARHNHDLTASQVASAVAADIPVALPKAFPKINWVPRQWRKWLGLAAGAAAIALPLPHSIPSEVLPRWVPRFRTGTDKRLKRLEKILGRTGLIALIAATLGGEIARLVRCPNTKGIAKAFCGANLNGLLGLLGGLAILETPLSLVSMAQGMLDVEEEMVGLIKGVFTELEGIG